MKIAALDIGGTSIKSGMMVDGRLMDVREEATNARNGGAYVMSRAMEILHSYDDMAAIGISTAGQVDTEQGSVYYANDNIPGYTGMKIRELLQAEFHVPVAVENDVNAAAIGEALYGSAKEWKDFLCLTIGTGVGGAIVLNRQVYTGSCYSAGSFGGILVHPEAVTEEEFSGCYGKYASTTGLVKRVQQIDAALDTGRKIFDVFSRPKIRAEIDAWIDEIVNGLGTLIHIFNPSAIVLGGGIMAQPYIITEVQRRVEKRVIQGFRHVKIVHAALGNEAGLYGAASLAEKLL